MSYIQGEGREQGTLFPVVLDDLIPQDHLCRVIDAFVQMLKIDALGFQRAEAAETGRPGYDPRDLLKLYLYGYLNQIRSSRRLEAECRRNIELMWLLHRVYPDHKTISEFRRMHRDAVAAAGAELVRFARAEGLIRGEWIVIDGSKFRAVSRYTREQEDLHRYLDEMASSDEKADYEVDPSKVAPALNKLRPHPEPEARIMRTNIGTAPSYNVQTAVDAEHALIVTYQVTTVANDSTFLQPVAEAAYNALGKPDAPVNIVADCGYSNGVQAASCEAAGLIPHVPVKRGTNNQAGRTLMDRSSFTYHPDSDCYICPDGKSLVRKRIHKRDQSIHYQSRAEDCCNCALKQRCTLTPQRIVSRHIHEDALERMNQRATPEIMRLRKSTVEHPFGTLKYRIFGHPRFLLRGLAGSRAEMSIAIMAYNLKRMGNVLGFAQLAANMTAGRA